MSLVLAFPDSGSNETVCALGGGSPPARHRVWSVLERKYEMGRRKFRPSPNSRLLLGALSLPAIKRIGFSTTPQALLEGSLFGGSLVMGLWTCGKPLCQIQTMGVT